MPATAGLRSTLNYLLLLLLAIRTSRRQLVVAGDFNAHHTDWDPGSPSNPRGRRLSAWARDCALEPSLVSTPTHWRGYTIDNIFTPLGLGVASCPPCEARSDHRLVELTAPSLAGPNSIPPRLRVPHKRYDDYVLLAKRGLDAIPDLPLTPTSEDLDEQASRITNALRLVAEAVGFKYRNAKAWP